jgi:hypothetical protein
MITRNRGGTPVEDTSILFRLQEYAQSMNAPGRPELTIEPGK